MDILKRFIDKIQEGEYPDDCVNWIACTDKAGYGRFSYKGEAQYAHRVSWILFHPYEKIIEGLQVLHHCDNRSCVNPNHLYLGSIQDNVDDRTRRGRANPPKGENHWIAKLTSKQVIAIRKCYETESAPTIAEKFGVSTQHIYNICCGVSWQHLLDSQQKV